ncbi:hypothetical protein BC943DRAFT_330164 [Umbelopsis sp. AD052]|nr:hypothetical protein BC943DRAFT_330164 [Umbelopsis sp. AD052]
MNGVKRQSSSSDTWLTNPKASAGMAAWFERLKKSYTRNFVYSEEPVFVHMSNIRRSGDVSMHSLPFQDFLEDDCRFLLFLLAMNDNLLMGDIKSDPNVKLCWNMPKTKEHFYLKGKFYIASAPIQVTRFPPPKIVDSDVCAVDYWEAERSKQWKQLDKRTRATFTWPASREAPKSDNIAFSCLSLDALPSEPVKGKPEPLKIVHDIAMDNFCLLIFKISAVEHFDYSMFPAKRTVSKGNFLMKVQACI